MTPLPVEATFFVSTYRSEANTDTGGPVGTAMIGLYSSDPPSRSLFHRLEFDEVWHFYGGDPLRLVLLYPDGSSADVVMGSDVLAGHVVQYVIPGWCLAGRRTRRRAAAGRCSVARWLRASPVPASKAVTSAICLASIRIGRQTSAGLASPTITTPRCRPISPRRSGDLPVRHALIGSKFNRPAMRLSQQ